MKHLLTNSFTITNLVLGLFLFHGCENPYDKIDNTEQWSHIYVPVEYRGVQVGLVGVAQRVITDTERNLDTESQIAFYQQDANDPVWRSAYSKLLIQVFDPGPSLSSKILHEQAFSTQMDTDGLGFHFPDTIWNLKSGFTRPFLAEQIRVLLLDALEASSQSGLYSGEAVAKGGSNLVELFSCPVHCTVNADGWLELRLVNHLPLIGITGQVSLSSSFGGNLYFDEDSIAVADIISSDHKMQFDFIEPILIGLDSITQLSVNLLPR